MTPTVSDQPAALLARMAEALYWAGRYLERAEDVARVVSVHGETHFDLPVGEDVGWLPVLEIAGSAGQFAEQFPELSAGGGAGSPGPSLEDRLIRFVLFDRGNPSSIITSLSSARSNLRRARPVVPREVWELANELWTRLRDGGTAVRSRDERARWLRTAIDQCHRMNGVLLGTMRRGDALTFLRLGQQVERASLTCRVLAARAESVSGPAGTDPYLDAHHMAVLRSLASYQPFRRAALSGEDPRASVRFLLRDPHLPRSFSACLAEVGDLAKGLPRNEPVVERCTDAAVAVAAAPIAELGTARLRAFLSDLEGAVRALHVQIADSYFDAAPEPVAGWRTPSRSTDDLHPSATIRQMEPPRSVGLAGMRCRVVHRTTYDYDEPVIHAYNEAHLRPRDTPGQHCLSHQLDVSPAPVSRTETTDPFGNRVTVFSVDGGFDHLSIEATSEVVTSVLPPPPSGPPWESVRAMLDIDRQSTGRDARQYRAPSRLVPAEEPFHEYALRSFRPSAPLVEATVDLATRIHRDFTYEPGVTTITTPLLEVYEHKRGVCQDFAHFMIACLRSLGLSARYVSGYIRSASTPGDHALVGGDASHAWAAICLPGWGWIDIDPTNDQLVGCTHVTTAWGRDYGDVSPIRGSVEGGGRSHRLQVSVRVEALPVLEQPASA